MKSPMQAFVGVDFDIEYSFMSGDWGITKKGMNVDSAHWYRFRPRLNKAQVLTDYTPILVDGFVWEVHLAHFIEDARWSEPCKFMIKSVRLKTDYTTDEDYTILSIAFKGVERGSEYEEWARAHDIPIYNKDMERVA